MPGRVLLSPITSGRYRSLARGTPSVEVVLFTSSRSNGADNPLGLPTCRNIRVGPGREADGLGSRRGRRVSSLLPGWCGVVLESIQALGTCRGALLVRDQPPRWLPGWARHLWTRGRVGRSKSSGSSLHATIRRVPSSEMMVCGPAYTPVSPSRIHGRQNDLKEKKSNGLLAKLLL
jgi:hypothetical protein